jgi:hypothetical protein
MFSQYFYHEHTRRAVAVFGTLFNDLYVIKRDGAGNQLQQIKVPLSYGPRQKFLARIRQEEQLTDPRLAIKLPRMSFEITSISYDESTRLTRGTQYKIPSASDPFGARTMFYPSTYRLGFELNIISKHQDDALQILEQILPYFQPEYTVTINEVDNNFKSDMPFVLNDVSLSDDYEGDFETRRSLIYTLTFETRIKYYGPLSDAGNVIRETKTNLSDLDMTSSGEPYVSQRITISPSDALESEEYTTVLTYDPKVYESAVLTFDSVSNGPLIGGESVIGQTSGATAVVSSVDSSSVTVTLPDDRFELSENVIGQTSNATFTITDIEPIWNTLA